MNPFGHVDLRVPSFDDVLPFYEKLLPALGFTITFHTAQWKVFAAGMELPSAAYFAITEDPDHVPNENMIGFWAESKEKVDELAKVVEEAGGTITDGPRQFPISPSYYAVYFKGPCGNKYEITYRVN